MQITPKVVTNYERSQGKLHPTKLIQTNGLLKSCSSQSPLSQRIQ